MLYIATLLLRLQSRRGATGEKCTVAC